MNLTYFNYTSVILTAFIEMLPRRVSKVLKDSGTIAGNILQLIFLADLIAVEGSRIDCCCA